MNAMAKFGTLIWTDIVKAVFTAVLTAVLSAIVPILQSGNFPTGAQLKTIALAGLAAGVAYLIKNMLTNSKDELLKTEPK
jgi:hypothetical protein